MTMTILRRTTLFTILTLVGVAGAIAQTPRLNVTGTQARAVIDRIRMRTVSMQRELDRARYNDGSNGANNAEDRISTNLTTIASSALTLRSSMSRYSSNTDASTSLNSIFESANRVNRILTRNAADTRVTSQWTLLQNDINTLATYYGVTANWDTRGGGNGSGWNNNNNGGWTNGAWNDRVTGTYRLNTSSSDNVTDVIDRSLNTYAADQRDNQRRMLERRLASPDVIVIQKTGNQVTMGSSNQAQVTFAADGVAHTETNPRGRQVTTRVTSTNNMLTIDYSGDRVNDFNVEFATDRSGRLRVTRKIYLENGNQTVSVSSIYDRISQTADWSQARQNNDNNGYNNNNSGTGTAGGFYIRNGETLTATLRNTVSTRASQTGDRFVMDVTSPSNYRGAVIEGRISQATNSGRINGRANVQMDFETITVGGRTYQFAGLIQSVSSINGDTVTVNNEGTIRDSNQTTKTVTRAGIGAALGALIGAIAGGGSGAAIGAGVGAGAGAGSVLLGGRDSIELASGSTFTILTSAPANVGYQRN